MRFIYFFAVYQLRSEGLQYKEQHFSETSCNVFNLIIVHFPQIQDFYSIYEQLLFFITCKDVKTIHCILCINSLDPQ